MLLKTIPLILGNYGFTSQLKTLGFETFEDFFGLDTNWDQCSEIDRIMQFKESIIKINEMDISKIQEFYLKNVLVINY